MSSHATPPDELLDSRSDPDARSVLADWHLSRGEPAPRLGLALSFIGIAADSADSADSAADADDADSAADADDADADADADDADADADAAIAKLFMETPDMEDGIKIIQLPGRYGYSATFVAWFRRVRGDWWEMVPGARAIYVTGTRRGLHWIAANGPGNDYTLRPPSQTVESVHCLVARRVINANEQAWAKHCPRPEGWVQS